MTTPDFSKIWAASTPLTPYVFDDADYLDGWEFLGEIPPDRRMFDAWQNQADTKMQWLYQNTAYLLRQNNTTYAVGDIAFSAALPSNLVLVCTTAGTTAATEPDMRGAVIGDTVTDGTAVWTYMPLGTLSREITPAFNHRDEITTSGTYTAPVSGWYKITVKGGGGGGRGGMYITGVGVFSGSGGGEGGATVGFEYMTAGQTATVTIGAGGTGGASSGGDGGNGGASTVIVNGNTYTGGGGIAGRNGAAGSGGDGTITGASGGAEIICPSINTSISVIGASGGGNGGGRAGVAGKQGGGGGGGSAKYTEYYNAGAAGGDGFAWFEYFAEV